MGTNTVLGSKTTKDNLRSFGRWTRAIKFSYEIAAVIVSLLISEAGVH